MGVPRSELAESLEGDLAIEDPLESWPGLISLENNKRKTYSNITINKIIIYVQIDILQNTVY